MSGNTPQNLPGRLDQVTASYRAAWPRPPWRAEAARKVDRLAECVDLALDEPSAVQQVRDAAAELREAPHLSAVLPRITETAMSIMGAEFGDVQIVDPGDGSLLLVTQSGFGSEFLDHFAVVRDDSSVYGQAARQSAQIVVADVRDDRAFAPHQQIFRAAGVRAFQSTPLIDGAGRMIGMVSTHASQPGRPSDRDLRIMELYGWLAGAVVAGHLRGSPPAHDGLTASAHVGATSPWPDPSSLEPLMRQALSDTINRLFSAGLNLAGTLQLLTHDDLAAQRVQAGLDELDEAIRSIQRTALDVGTRSDLRKSSERAVAQEHRRPARTQSASGH